MGFGLFALVVGLVVFFYGGHMTNRGRQADRAHRSHLH